MRMQIKLWFVTNLVLSLFWTIGPQIIDGNVYSLISRSSYVVSVILPSGS